MSDKRIFEYSIETVKPKGVWRIAWRVFTILFSVYVLLWILGIIYDFLKWR